MPCAPPLAKLVELLRARDAAETASRAKSAFLANMSHEVRTPLHSILGYAQVLLRDAGIEGESRDRLAVIQRSGEHLLGLLNDVLDVSSLEAGQGTSVSADVALKTLVEDAVRLHAPRAAAKGLTLTLDWSRDAPSLIAGDGEKLERILQNLLSNAVKFTERGGVTVAVAARAGSPQAHAGDRLTLAVPDTGPGIPPGDLELLFRPFAQARVGVEASGGTGLGLALARGLARLLGGDLTVQSRPGEGSTFVLEIPLQRRRAVSDAPSSRHRREERAPDLAAPSPPAPPSPGLAAQLSPALRAELGDAARTADYFRMMEILAPLTGEAAAELRALGERYDYEAIEQRLRG